MKEQLLANEKPVRSGAYINNNMAEKAELLIESFVNDVSDEHGLKDVAVRLRIGIIEPFAQSLQREKDMLRSFLRRAGGTAELEDSAFSE